MGDRKTMLLEELFNYTKPYMESFKSKNNRMIVSESKVNKGDFGLAIDGEYWMNYALLNPSQAYELFSQYYLAKGHCICTGLGFTVRESWISTKKSVEKITVIEKNKEVIEYHKYIKNPILEKLEIINCDASEYVGKCDTLLLDHHANEGNEQILREVADIQRNIQCQVLWFWPLEQIITDTTIIEGGDVFNTYLKLKEKHGLYKLPNISRELIEMFCFMFCLHNLKYKIEFSDRELTREELEAFT